MKLKVYRDAEGVVRNIGEWDYVVTLDEFGVEIINNPLPIEYVSTEEDVEVNDDGSRTVIEVLEEV